MSSANVYYSCDMEFSDDMFDALVCYVINTFTAIPRFCKMLDEPVREMVKNQPMEVLKFRVENLLPDIGSFLENRHDLIPPTRFDAIERFSETRLRKVTDLIQYVGLGGVESYEPARTLSRKRRRLSL